MPILQNPRHEAFAQARAKGALLEPGDLVTLTVASSSLDRLRSFVGRELGT